MIKKFNAVEYLVEKYVEGEYAIIPIKLDSPDEIFNKYDPTQTTLAPDVYHYIDRCVYNIPIKFKVKLKIICDNVTEETKEKMSNAVRNHYGLIVYDKNLDLKTNTYKTIWLLICGIFFLAFMYMFNVDNSRISWLVSGESIFKEILLVAGWFFIWEAVENFVSNRRNLRIDKVNNRQMLNAELFFEEELIKVE